MVSVFWCIVVVMVPVFVVTMSLSYTEEKFDPYTWTLEAVTVIHMKARVHIVQPASSILLINVLCLLDPSALNIFLRIFDSELMTLSPVELNAIRIKKGQWNNYITCY
jgi:hypothetical protein